MRKIDVKHIKELNSLLFTTLAVKRDTRSDLLLIFPFLAFIQDSFKKQQKLALENCVTSEKRNKYEFCLSMSIRKAYFKI